MLPYPGVAVGRRLQSNISERSPGSAGVQGVALGVEVSDDRTHQVIREPPPQRLVWRGMHPKHLRAEFPPLVTLALPLILGELGWIAMSAVDTAMLGRVPGSALALSASALAQVLFNTLAFGAGGVLLALDTLVSQALGEGDQPAANGWLLHGVVMASALAVLLVSAVAALPSLLLRLPVDRDVLTEAIPALRGLNYGVVPLLLYFALRRYLQSAHHGRLIMAALLSANVINALGDWLLIYGHHWQMPYGHPWGQHGRTGAHPLSIPAFGVTGSAWSTSAARLYLMVFLLLGIVWVNRRHGYRLRETPRRVEWAQLRRILQLGAPVGAQIFVEVAIFALTTAVIATFGRVPLAGHEIALQCASTVFMVPLAISGATAVRVGHAIGRARVGLAEAGNIAAAGWSGILFGATFMLLSAITFWTIPARVARLFTPDREVVAAAVPLLLVAAAFQFFDGVQSTACGALHGAGRTLSPLLIQLVCFWAVGMPLGLLFAFPMHMGAVGMWWGLALGLSPAAVALLWQWRRVTQGAEQLIGRETQAAAVSL